jgi:hypothetical protein
LSTLVPLFIRLCGDGDDEEQQTDAANDLREHCLPGLEALVVLCPRHMSPACVMEVVALAVRFSKYDPNYTYEEEEEEGTEGGGEGEAADEEGGMLSEDEFDLEDQGGMSDDDDSSWKVRKNAVKLISAVIQMHPELLSELYEVIAPALIRRFKEREESVRADIVNCLNALLLQSLALPSSSVSPLRSTITFSHSASGDKDAEDILESSAARASLQSSNIPVANILRVLLQASMKQLSGNSVNTKSAVFAMLRTLVLLKVVAMSVWFGFDKFLC